MPLAIFDLDNTLLSDDSDHLWGQYLCDIGAVDQDFYRRENDRFYAEYRAGTLDIFEFLRFSLKPLATYPMHQLLEWRAEFMQERILPVILPLGRELVARHRQQGDTLLIITATNRFVTEPIAAELGISHLLATEPAMTDGQYTGQISGTPCYREGKITNLQSWLQQHGESLDEATFYSDSHNDIPLLELIPNPVAVDPDKPLAAHARERCWPVISLRSVPA